MLKLHQKLLKAYFGTRFQIIQRPEFAISRMINSSHHGEIILTLELYYNLDSGRMNSGRKEVIELSEFLNKLPIGRIIRWNTHGLF